MTDRLKDPVQFEIAFYEGVVKTRPDYIEALVPLAEAYTRKGLYQKGMEIDKRLVKLCPDDPFVYYNLACSYALLARKKEALVTLRKAVEFGYADFTHMRKDQDLKSLHGEPGFESLASIA